LQVENNVPVALSSAEEAGTVSNESSSVIDLNLEAVLTHHRPPACDHYSIFWTFYIVQHSSFYKLFYV